MPRYGLGRKAMDDIEAAVDDLFDRVLARFIGPHVLDHRIIITTRPELTLGGIFHAANAEERTRPDQSVLDQLTKIATSYIDAQRAIVKPRVVKAVDSWLKDAATKGIETTPQRVLGGELSEIWKKAASDLERIVDSESTNARNMGVLDGIEKINHSQGIDDPVVYFIVVRDRNLCDECRRLHLQGDGVTPRLWLLSEVSNGYHQKGEDTPSIGGLHPHCRCSLSTLMPSYGFGVDGKVKFIGLDHDEFKAQRKG